MHLFCLNLCFWRKGRDTASTADDTPKKPEDDAQSPVNQQFSTSPRVLTSKAKQEPQIPSIPDILPSQVEDTLGECPRPLARDINKVSHRSRWKRKSSLIANIFNLDKDNIHIAHNAAGDANIEHGYTSPENLRFILHDSKGFEAGSGSNLTKVQSFLERRQGTDHVPVIAVFTKYDILIAQFHRKDPANAERDASVYFTDKIKEFGEDLKRLSIDPDLISHARVSTTDTNAKGLSEGFKSDFILKKSQYCANDWESEYWKNLGESSAFEGQVLIDYIHRLHEDVLKVWNFNDPTGILSGISFFVELIGFVKPLIEKTLDETSCAIFEMAKLYADSCFQNSPPSVNVW
ncbi:hypothetical protein CVT25_004976 [Psilocybe cyanescens]|uniref:G domain-containing protein n=1 Tax=Psilocybe cyanescens TaxID=93625 RepID=A0A409XTW7_PSICY|nr:hypothetical protein CVT25_004976 [Psilocybe cyanescens]